MTKYVTNLSRSAIDHWCNYEAVREFCQNWLDSDSEKEYEITEDSITLTNKNIKVSNKMLMMGLSDKRNDPTKRGKFGTGSVFAMCVLTARGINVSIQNNDVLWDARFEHCEKFDEDVMVIDETPYYPSTDFVVTITGLSAEDISDIKQTNLVFQDREVLASSKYGEVINSVDDQGEVYCGDLFVQQTQGFKYSYNIKPEYLTLNQDRQSLSEWDLQSVTAKLIMDTGDDDLIQEAINAKTLDTTKMRYWGEAVVPDEIAEKFTEEFLEDEYNQGKILTSCYSDHMENEELGNPSIYMDNPVKVQAITSTHAYKESIESVELAEKVIPTEVVEKCKDLIMDILSSNCKAEACQEVESLLESLLETSEGWSGDTNWDDLPF